MSHRFCGEHCDPPLYTTTAFRFYIKKVHAHILSRLSLTLQMAVEKNANMDNVPHVDNKDPAEFDMMLKDAAPKMDKMWWHYPHLRQLNFFLAGAILVQATNGYDGSMLNGLQSLGAWENYFNHPQGASLGTLSSGTTFGVLLTIFPTSYLCDRYGRRWPIIAGSILTVIGAIIQSVAQNFGTFWVGRFIIGMGLGLLNTTAPMLLAETAYPTQRSVLTSLYETSFPFGALVGALITFGSYYIDSTWAWRLPSLLQCSPALSKSVLCTFALNLQDGLWHAVELKRLVLYL